MSSRYRKRQRERSGRLRSQNVEQRDRKHGRTTAKNKKSFPKIQLKSGPFLTI